MGEPDLDYRQLLRPVARAEDAMSRLDERLRTSPVRDGWLSRVDYLDASAAVQNEGELVLMEDFVLHVHAMDIRAPTPELRKASDVLKARREAAERPTADTLTLHGVRGLVGSWKPQEVTSAPKPVVGVSDAVRDLLAFTMALEAEQDLPASRPSKSEATPVEKDAAFDEWMDVMRDVGTLPDTLAAAILIQQWHAIDPIPKKAWVGRLLASVYLVHRKRLDVLLPFHIGRRRFHAHKPKRRPAETLVDILDQMELAAQESFSLHSKLLQVHSLMQRKSMPLRRNSRLDRVASLLISHPIVTSPMIERHANVTDRGASLLIKQLGSVPREVTGRRRYRAWAVA